MAYLLDANIFIQAKNDYYGMDFCPAFWDWLLEQNTVGNVFSIEKVADELTAGNDDLSTWATQRGSSFFLPSDQQMAAMLPRISRWVTGQNYRADSVNRFLQGADYYLIAYALAHTHVVVTQEKPSGGGQVKIPDVCNGMHVVFKNPFEMLRIERAKFVLSNLGSSFRLS
jgi:hypothetical protein